MSIKMNCLLLCILTILSPILCYQCDRTPTKATKPPNRVETDLYVIEINGNLKSYVPGENYTITLKANPSNKERRRFTEFTLVAEPSNIQKISSQDPLNTGRFGLYDSMITTFSTRCPNTVIQTNTLLKSSITVWWVAPESNSGCLDIKATVFESTDSWFTDDGELTKHLCEEQGEDEDKPPPVLKNCCACDEAKYELAFEGKWSRNTHPKDFPTDIWRTKFSDIVGASHKLFKSFWHYGGMASAGLRTLAETGNTKDLESELKEMVKNDDIRTIIKARELTYPNTTGTSYTVFRVDNENHVLSIVSKLTPSPDWIVGVANLELCTKSCQWVERQILNLYPWDVGTREGYSYTDDDGETYPQQPIRRIKSNNPNKEESPFFNPDGESMKPLAKITVTRQKLYEKECADGRPSPDNEEIDPNCATTEWHPWSSCTLVAPHCLKFRQRTFANEGASKFCQTKLEEWNECRQDECSSDQNNAYREMFEENDSRCELSEWSSWSNCSAHLPCGKGVMTRDRSFVNPIFEKNCPENEMQQTEECQSEDEECDENEQIQEENCPNTEWDVWSPCSVTCGNGIKERYRIKTTETDDNEETDDEGSASCSNNKQVVECYNPPCDEDQIETTTSIIGISADSQTKDNFHVTNHIDGPIIDCKVSKWSIWGPCEGSRPCKKGYKYRKRNIIRHAQNGGRSCPKKLLKKKRCIMPCDQEAGTSDRVEVDDVKDTLPTWGPSEPINRIKIDCVMDNWSAWSPCSTNCGGSAVQIRTRGIKVYPRNGGRPCLERKQTRKCPLPISCADDRGTFNY